MFLIAVSVVFTSLNGMEKFIFNKKKAAQTNFIPPHTAKSPIETLATM